MVHRSYEPLVVSCSFEDIASGMVTVQSSTKAMAFGNIIFGGVIGAGVDIGTGAAYDYPDNIKVVMAPKVPKVVKSTVPVDKK